jgi:hypothetical protein
MLIASMMLPAIIAQRGVEYTRQRYRPLIGGIQIEITCGMIYPYRNCTINYAVATSSGVLGIIHSSSLYSLFKCVWRASTSAQLLRPPIQLHSVSSMDQHNL